MAGQNDATQNRTLIRKSNIQSGNVDWLLSAGSNAENSEWIVSANDDVTNLGFHSLLNQQEIQIPNGWFMLGVNTIPEVNSMEVLFESVIDHLLIAKDVNGDVFLPEWAFDNIGALEIGEGLLIKVDEAQLMTIQGSQIDLYEYPLQIPIGWSIKSYLNQAPIDVLEFVENNQDIVIIKDYLGNACLPSMSFNGIGSFQPGQAYFIKSLSEISISWE